MVSGQVHVGSGMHVPYIQFVMPALIAGAAMAIAVDESSYSYMDGLLWSRSFYTTYQTPITAVQIVTGTTLFIFIRSALACTIYAFLAYALGIYDDYNAGYTVIIAAAGALPIGLAVSAYVSSVREDRGQIQVLGRLLILPLFLFSGTFFPLEDAPWPLEIFGLVSPLTHVSQIARITAATLHEPIGVTLLRVIYLLFVATTAFAVTTMWVKKRLVQ